MDVEQYRVEMKEKIKKAREEIEKKHTKISLDIDHVRHLSRKKNDALRDSLNEIDKKLDRIYELDSELKLMLKNDIDDLWRKIQLILEV